MNTLLEMLRELIEEKKYFPKDTVALRDENTLPDDELKLIKETLRLDKLDLIGLANLKELAEYFVGNITYAGNDIELEHSGQMTDDHGDITDKWGYYLPFKQEMGVCLATAISIAIDTVFGQEVSPCESGQYFCLIRDLFVWEKEIIDFSLKNIGLISADEMIKIDEHFSLNKLSIWELRNLRDIVEIYFRERFPTTHIREMTDIGYHETAESIGQDWAKAMTLERAIVDAIDYRIDYLMGIYITKKTIEEFD